MHSHSRQYLRRIRHARLTGEPLRPARSQTGWRSRSAEVRAEDEDLRGSGQFSVEDVLRAESQTLVRSLKAPSLD